MSLEQAVEKLTARFDALIAILAAENAPAITAPAAENDPGFGAAVNSAAKAVVAETKARRAKKEAAPEAPAGEPVEETTAPSPEAGATDAPATEDAAAPTEPVTRGDIQKAAARLINLCSLDKTRAVAIVQSFGVQNSKDLKDEQLPALHAALLEAISEIEASKGAA
jgi:hypothetical protein